MLKFPRRRRIYLMRHGEAAYVSNEGVVTDDPNNVPLTPMGREQARAQGEMLQDIQIQRTICSSFPRTRETLGIVLESLQQTDVPQIETVHDLREIQGLEGDRQWPPDADQLEATLADIANPWRRGAEPGARFLGGEAFADFEQRVTRAWRHIIEDDSWDNALIVLHGAVNRMILNHLLGLSWSGDFCIEQDNCCLNIIDVDSTTPFRYLVRAVNVTAYNLSKADIHLTSMEATAQRIAQTIDR